VLHYTRTERFAGDKHSSLLDQFVSYEKNKVLWIRDQMTAYGSCRGCLSFYSMLDSTVGIKKYRSVFKDLNRSHLCGKCHKQFTAVTYSPRVMGYCGKTAVCRLWRQLIILGCNLPLQCTFLIFEGKALRAWYCQELLHSCGSQPYLQIRLARKNLPGTNIRHHRQWQRKHKTLLKNLFFFLLRGQISFCPWYFSNIMILTYMGGAP
jgi:hypothetical protein